MSGTSAYRECCPTTPDSEHLNDCRNFRASQPTATATGPSTYVGSPLATTPHERARRALADLSTPTGFVLGDVIARLVLDSGVVVPAEVQR